MLNSRQYLFTSNYQQYATAFASFSVRKWNLHRCERSVVTDQYHFMVACAKYLMTMVIVLSRWMVFCCSIMPGENSDVFLCSSIRGLIISHKLSQLSHIYTPTKWLLKLKLSSCVVIDFSYNSYFWSVSDKSFWYILWLENLAQRDEVKHWNTKTAVDRCICFSIHADKLKIPRHERVFDLYGKGTFVCVCPLVQLGSNFCCCCQESLPFPCSYINIHLIIGLSVCWSVMLVCFFFFLSDVYFSLI